MNAWSLRRFVLDAGIGQALAWLLVQILKGSSQVESFSSDYEVADQKGFSKLAAGWANDPWKFMKMR